MLRHNGTWFEGSSPKALALVVLVMWCGMLTSGCPTYEDSYSGTYREVVDGELGRDAFEIDFFRFGDNSAAIVRVYKPDPITGDPFGESRYCVWTSAEPFDEDDKQFRLFITKDSSQLPRSQLFGNVVDDETMDISLFEERTGQPYEGLDEQTFERHRDTPKTNCEVIEDLLVQIDFPRDPDTGALQRIGPEAGYDIESPVLAVSWVGFQQASDGVFAPLERHAPAVILDAGNFDRNRQALKNDRPLLIPPPPEIVRMPSGNTTMALGHFVVIDDSPQDRPTGDPDDWEFDWETDDERLIATTLQRATRPACDSGTDRWGRALLFVEGGLDELSLQMQSQIDGIANCRGDDTCDEHFYMVDVCAEGDQVRTIVLDTAGRAVPRVAMLVTEEYLHADWVPLPRVNPFRPW
jgi:hypothetical protein